MEVGYGRYNFSSIDACKLLPIRQGTY